MADFEFMRRSWNIISIDFLSPKIVRVHYIPEGGGPKHLVLNSGTARNYCGLNGYPAWSLDWDDLDYTEMRSIICRHLRLVELPRLQERNSMKTLMSYNRVPI